MSRLTEPGAYHRLRQANVATEAGTDRARPDGADITLTIQRHEGGGNTSTFAALITPTEAIAIARDLLRIATDPDNADGWYVTGLADTEAQEG